MNQPPQPPPLTFYQTLVAAAIGAVIATFANFGVEWFKNARERHAVTRQFKKERLTAKESYLHELTASILDGQSKMDDCYYWRNAMHIEGGRARGLSQASLNEVSEHRAAREAERDRADDAYRLARSNFERTRAELESSTLQWLVLAEKASPLPGLSDDESYAFTEHCERVRKMVLIAVQPPQATKDWPTPGGVASEEIEPLLAKVRTYTQKTRECLNLAISGKRLD